MNVPLLVRLLWQRQQLRQRERWRRDQLLAYQERAARALRSHAYARSRFYQRFHHGLMDRPLQELPVLTKAQVMENFDELVTDQAVRLRDVAAHVRAIQTDEQFHGRYWTAATSGSTGSPGVFLFDVDEWSIILAGMARASDWAGLGAGLGHRTRTAIVASTTPWHMSARTGASVRSWWTPTLRMDATGPVGVMTARLNAWRPQGLVGYPSVLHILADEQLGGRLHIHPRSIMASGEVLTAHMRQRVALAWGQPPFEVYAVSETGTLAAECGRHNGMHLMEDLVITEIVDEANRPVPPGGYGEKVLITVLFSRTLPLVRYEISDSVRLSTEPCACGRPFVLLNSIQGRREDVLHFGATAGNTVAVHPNAIHQVMDLVPAQGWQVIQRPGEITVLLQDVSPELSEEALSDNLRAVLEKSGAIVPKVTVQHVAAIPRGRTGKAPLIRSELPQGG